ncbi:hypothetical protein M2137_000566 [Parabacteroides sp. PFB2-10]|nr:hypothetical protein [Parabacteroides sp. PFB2-10]
MGFLDFKPFFFAFNRLLFLLKVKKQYYASCLFHFSCRIIIIFMAFTEIVSKIVIQEYKIFKGYAYF